MKKGYHGHISLAPLYAVSGRHKAVQFTVSLPIFFFQAEDGIRDYKVTGVQDVFSSDLAFRLVPTKPFTFKFCLRALKNNSISHRSLKMPRLWGAPNCGGLFKRPIS